jgi:phage terminase large subunit-like protein
MKNVQTAEDKRELERYLSLLKKIENNSSVDYEETSEDKKSRIKRASKDYAFFVQYYFPHYAQYECADFHIEAANKIKSKKDIKAILEWFRGAAKSTHADVFIPTWLHLFHNELSCMILVGKNEKSAKRLLSDVQAEFEANEQLKHDFGNLVQSGSWEEGNFITTTGCAFYSLGKGQSPRGLRNGPKRPDLIVVDDIDDDEECRNPRRVDETVNWILRALIPAMGSEITRFVMVNNRIANYSVLAKLASNTNFYHIKVNALDKSGHPTWFQKYSKEFYDNLIKVIGWFAFETEYMNNPQVEGKIFASKYIQWQPILKLNKYDRIVAHWDVAYSESKTADTNAVAIVGKYEEQKHVLKTFCTQCKMEDALRFMYNVNNRLPKGIEIEWYCESQFWNDAVELTMQGVAREYGYRLPITFTDRPTENKFSRIVKMVPDFQRSEIYFNETEKHNTHMQTGIGQLSSIEIGYKTKDDFPDALEGCVSMLNAERVMDDSLPVLGNRNKLRQIF